MRYLKKSVIRKALGVSVSIILNGNCKADGG